MTKLSKKLLGLFLAVCMLASLFTCLTGIMASAASGVKMFKMEFPAGDDGSVITDVRIFYTSLPSANFVPEKKYTFSCKYLSDYTADIAQMIGIWAKRTGATGYVRTQCPDFTENYDSETHVYTCSFTTLSDLYVSDTDWNCEIDLGNRNGKTEFNNCTAYFADLSLIREDTGEDLLAGMPIDESLVQTTTGQEQGKWYIPAPRDQYATIEDKGNTFGDGEPGDYAGPEIDPETGEVIVPAHYHTGGTATCHSKAVCTVCSKEYGEFDANNHDGGTEVRDAVEATATEDGYTGDTYCLGCGAKIADGEVIPATGGGEQPEPSNNMFVVESTRSYPAIGYLSADQVLVAGKSYTFTCKFLAPEEPNAFDFSDDSTSLRNMFGFWGANSDDNSNAFWWRMTSHTISYDAETKTVTAKITASDDSNGTAMGPYAKIVIGDRNANFRGWGTFYFADPTFVCDDNPEVNLLADCPIDEAHYVADGSAATLAQHKGMWVSYDDAAEPEVPTIADKGNTFGDGEEPGECEHTGGTATCHSKAVCTVCGEEYGEFDANNHDGGTEVRDAVEATATEDGYTGDTYCLGCGALIAAGEVIPATGGGEQPEPSNNMFVVESTRSYPAVGYLSADQVLVAGKSYTFTCKFVAPEEPNAFDFSDDSTSLRNMFGFWGANSDDNSNAFWWRMTNHTISYDAETKTVTAKITASDDSNGTALGPHIKIVIGDRNANFRGWGTFYFADPTFVCDDNPEVNLLADCPIDEAHYVADGSAATLAQHKGMWVSYDDAAEPEVPTIADKGNTFGDAAYEPGDINGDGEVDNKDLTRLFQYLSNWDVEVNKDALDVNGDGSVDNKDLTRLFQYLSNWDVDIF